MAKRQRRSSSKANAKVMSEDRISLLPDAILVSILCLLSFKESIATSLLSHRWRYVWTFVPKLDFEGPKSYRKIKFEDDYEEEIHQGKYVRWFDSVIALHKSPAIEEFRVYFNLNKSHEKYIDRWVEYALAGKVKRLELNLGVGVICNCGCYNAYTFPFNHSTHFKYLEKICLSYVNVNGEAVEFFLSNCPLLNHLSVSKSNQLLTLKVIGPFPSLKHLEIMACRNLSSVEIRDTNLVYLKYSGESIQPFVLNNVPLLVEMHIDAVMEMRNFLAIFSSILPQLEKLTFKMGCVLRWEETEMFFTAVKISNIKQLVLYPISEGYSRLGKSYLPVSNILRSSPCLETFELVLGHTCIRRRVLQKIEAGSYDHLKEVKISGYCGAPAELEFLKHLWESAAALEKIIIVPEEKEAYREEFPSNRTGRERARVNKQLVTRLPSKINLQIL